MVEISPADKVLEAAKRLAQGKLVAFPTETVYGLGADAENPEAIARIYAAKQRPLNHPVIVHLAPDVDPGYWVKGLPPQAQSLIAKFWPGPLTLILKRADYIPDAVSGGQDSIGIRCPSHPVAQNLLHSFAGFKSHGNGGIAAPSANKFGQVSPTLASHVQQEFSDFDSQSLMILDGGPAEVGIESTIIDLSRLHQGVAPTLLRPGGINILQLAEALGDMPLLPDEQAPRVSGSLKSHYAPKTPVVLLTLADLQDWSCNSVQPGFLANKNLADLNIAAVVFDGDLQHDIAGIELIKVAKDPELYAHNLYAILRDLDSQSYDYILLQKPSSTPLWQGVIDRITRAAFAFN